MNGEEPTIKEALEIHENTLGIRRTSNEELINSLKEVKKLNDRVGNWGYQMILLTLKGLSSEPTDKKINNRLKDAFPDCALALHLAEIKPVDYWLKGLLEEHG